MSKLMGAPAQAAWRTNFSARLRFSARSQLQVIWVAATPTSAIRFSPQTVVSETEVPIWRRLPKSNDKQAIHNAILFLFQKDSQSTEYALLLGGLRINYL